MGFPTQNIPNGDTFKYRDRDNGRTWVHDNAVWTPREPTTAAELRDVFVVGDTLGPFEDLLVIPREAAATTTNLTSGNTQVNNVMFQVVLGEDVRIQSIELTGITRDASMTSGYFEMRAKKQDFGALGATDGLVSPATFNSYFSGSADMSRGYSSFSFNQDPTTVYNSTFGQSNYSLFTIVRAGEPLWIGLRATSGVGGDWYYDDVPGKGIKIKGYRLSGGPVEYSKLQWSTNGVDNSFYRWTSDRPDHRAPYNLITRQTVDPTPGDLASHQLGTYWLNTTTNRVWIHAAASGGFDGSPADAKWIQFPVYNEHKVKPAIAQVRNGEADPYVVPPYTGEFMVDTATNQLKLYDGTSWIVL